jgi:hypothetical protein
VLAPAERAALEAQRAVVLSKSVLASPEAAAQLEAALTRARHVAGAADSVARTP